MARLKQHIGWLSAAIVVTALSLGLVFGWSGGAQAQTIEVGPEIPLPPSPSIVLPPLDGEAPARLAQGGSNQIFRGDLVVEAGRIMRGDIAVYSGDVRVEEGGQIEGDLVVYSGDIEIQPGASIGGDVTAFSGDIEIDGSVGGSVASWSGNVELSPSARVEGDISVLSGEIERAEGAYVGGDIVEGPQLRLPGRAERVVPAPAPAAPVVVRDRDSGFFGWLGRLILRLLGALLVTALVVLLTGVLAYARPDMVRRARGRLNENVAMSFVVGLLANLVLLFLAGMLSITICLLPVALIPILLLFGINLAGWAVLSEIVGERITNYVKQPVQSALTVAVGAVVLTGLVALLWAFGGCFRFIGFLALLGVSSFGAGAVLLPWLNRRAGGEPPTRPAGRGVPPAGPAGGAAPTAARGPVVTETAPDVSGPDVSGGGIDESVLREEVDEPLDYVTAQDFLAAQAEDVQDDDFTRIKGIGPVFDQRLKNAGIRTFGELAITSPERIAEIIGWPVDRVLRSDLPGQARYFSENR